MRAILILALLLTAPVLTLHAQEATPTPGETIVVNVWWPDALYDQFASPNILDEQFAEFNRSNIQIRVEFRLKQAQGNGSILNTLIAGERVAPSAMPDLVLLHRADLEEAVENGIVKNIDAWVPDAMRDNLLPNTLNLGEVNGVLYGLPYSLTLQQVVYHDRLLENTPLTFAGVLNEGQPFLFPGLPRSDQQVNEVILAQYLHLGGQLFDSNGKPVLDRDPMLEILAFYETGLEEGIFSPEIANYDSSSDYWPRFEDRDIALVLANSTEFLQGRRAVSGLKPISIPSPNETPLVLVDGWLWALVTPNPDQQNAVLDFLEWMMQPDHQADYTETFGVLPSQRSALRIWADEEYASLVTEWMPDSMMLLTEQRSNKAAIQLQAAFIAVLNGTPAAEAADTAISNLAQ